MALHPCHLMYEHEVISLPHRSSSHKTPALSVSFENICSLYSGSEIRSRSELTVN